MNFKELRKTIEVEDKDKMKALEEDKRLEKRRCIWLFGPTAGGKTLSMQNIIGKRYKYYVNAKKIYTKDKSVNWNDYKGERKVILDEFSVSAKTIIADLKTWTEPYKIYFPLLQK